MLVVQLADGLLKRYALPDLESGLQNVVGRTQQALGTEGRALAPQGHNWALGLNSGAIVLGRADAPPPLDPDADRDALIAQACRIANRNLYEVEWKTYMGDAGYRKTCPAVEGAP